MCVLILRIMIGFLVCLLHWLNQVSGTRLSVWLGEIICLRFVVLSEQSWKQNYFSLLVLLTIPWKSLWPPNGIYFYTNVWPLLAICYGDLWISWTCWVVYTIFAICPAPSWILCLNMLQTSSKVTSPHEKSNWSVCFKSFLLICGQMFLLCFFPD